MMSRTLFTTVATFLAAVLLIGFVACGKSGPSEKAKKRKRAGQTPKASSPGSESNTRPDGFVVVQVNDVPRIVRTADLDSLRFELRAGHKEALDQYKRENQAAGKSGAPFDRPKPARPRLKVSKKTFATEPEAAIYRERLLAKKSAKKMKAKKQPVNPSPGSKTIAEPPDGDPPPEKE